MVVFVRQVEGKSAVMTSPDYETNVSGFVFFFQGRFSQILRKGAETQKPLRTTGLSQLGLL